MIIRKASIKDTKYITTYLLMAMEDIVYVFIGQKDDKKAFDFLSHFVAKKNNQYSWENIWVVEESQNIIAAANLYDGADLYKLRAPIVEYLKTQFGRDFSFEDETDSGEIYLDCIAVHPDHQGHGVGKKLLSFIINEFAIKNQKPLGLLVDEDNSAAKKLYMNLGFKPIGEKILASKKMAHLQINRQ